MTLVPGLELLPLRKVPPSAPLGAPVLIALEPPPAAAAVVTLEDEALEVVEAQSPLAIITWAAAVVGAGLATVAAMLLLGPILGTLAVVATTVAVVRRYEQADAPEIDVSS